MGCFSYMCKVSGKPILSDCISGSPVHLFLLKKGEVIEHMYGNYDSYGRVFSNLETGESFIWKTDWYEIVDLHFGADESYGVAAILDQHYSGNFPSTRSENDPNQGWGEDYAYLSSSNGSFPVVGNPFHKVIGLHNQDSGNATI